jgi:hypothetical protein
VPHYLLAQAFRAIGRTADHEAALAEFTRLRALARDGSAALPGRPPSDVTPQAIDPKPPS